MTNDPSPSLAPNELYIHVEVGPDAVVPESVRVAITDLARALHTAADDDVSGHGQGEKQWERTPMRFRGCFDPVPVKRAKWELSEFDASKNEVAIETLE